MRSIAVISLMLLACLCGCTRFAGEWLEEGSLRRDGALVPADTERRQAMRFDWPATVRYGSYSDLAGVVDDETVQWDQYWTLKGDEIAQSGAMSAHMENGKLVMVVDGDVRKQFEKVHGKSIFPPQVKFPSLSSQ